MIPPTVSPSRNLVDRWFAHRSKPESVSMYKLPSLAPNMGQ
jgi:hypothetical protein